MILTFITFSMWLFHYVVSSERTVLLPVRSSIVGSSVLELPVRSSWLLMQFSPASSLDHCLLVLFITERGLLRFPSIIMDFVCLYFQFCQFIASLFKALLLGINVIRIVISS